MKKFYAFLFVPFLAISGCTSSTDEDKTIRLFGAISVPPAVLVDEDGEQLFSRDMGEDEFLESGGECFAKPGYDDIDEGVQVTVKNGSGETIGIGSLNAGTQQPGPELTFGSQRRLELPICEFEFDFEVPAGEDFYAVSIGNSNRGELTYTEEELAEGIYLSLG